MKQPLVDDWLYPAASGLYCAPGQFYIDPHRAVERAIITHGHGDHARPGHHSVLATAQTIAIMKVRYGPHFAGNFQSLPYDSALDINGVSVRLAPAGHILGSAQIVLEWRGTRVVVSGDYKRRPDPTCAPFEVIACDIFVTEATFALPVFRHGDPTREIQRLLQSMTAESRRTHLIAAYGLGKCQRLIKLLRQAGYDDPIYLHGAHLALTELYQQQGIELGDIQPVGIDTEAPRAGGLVICPPSALADRWTRHFDDPVTGFASGWMRVRGRARQYGIELPLVVSDHADWPELIDTIQQTNAAEVWVTHGREDALVYHLGKLGMRAKALALVGREDEAD